MDMKKKGWLNSYEFRHSLAALGFDMSKPAYFRELLSYRSVSLEWHDPPIRPVNRLYVYLDQFRLSVAYLPANCDSRQQSINDYNMSHYARAGALFLQSM